MKRKKTVLINQINTIEVKEETETFQLINPMVRAPLEPIQEEEPTEEMAAKEITLRITTPQKPPLKAVVLDNDETTGSYGLIFSLLTHLRNVSSLTDEDVAKIYERLAFSMDYYDLFRPHMKELIQTLDGLQTENYIDSVIMYTNQTDELEARQPHITEAHQFSIKALLYSVPLTIAYLMNEVYGLIVFDRILSRPPLLRGIRHNACPKSFSRILDFYPEHQRSTEKILFVDDNASPEFITACPNTKTHPHSYVRIQPYVRILATVELEAILTDVLHGMSVPTATLQAIKDQYRRHAPLERIAQNNTEDNSLESLRLALIEFYAT